MSGEYYSNSEVQVKKVGKQRQFKLVDVKKMNGCKTKFDGNAVFRGDKANPPFAAAKKAFNKTCRVKRTRGQCSLLVSLQEITPGSQNALNGKQFHYSLKQVKNPELKMVGKGNTTRAFEYTTKGNAVSASFVKKPKCPKGETQSRGRMLGKTSKVMNKVHKAVNNKKKYNSKNMY